MNLKRKIAVAVSVVVAIVVALVLFIAYELGLLGSPFNDKKFVRSVWLASAHNDDARNPRGRMAEDLISNHLRIGMSKSDVRKLLGKSNNSEYDETQNTDCYFLGHWGFMSIDGDYLIIRYNNAYQIKSTEIYVH